MFFLQQAMTIQMAILASLRMFVSEKDVHQHLVHQYLLRKVRLVWNGLAGTQTLYLDHVLETVIMTLIVLQDLYAITMLFRQIALELFMNLVPITATTLMHQ